MVLLSARKCHFVSYGIFQYITRRSHEPVFARVYFVRFSNHMLDISGGFHEMGGVRWQLTLCLLLCWVIVFLALAKGITVSGKVSACL